MKRVAKYMEVFIDKNKHVRGVLFLEYDGRYYGLVNTTPSRWVQLSDSNKRRLRRNIATAIRKGGWS